MDNMLMKPRTRAQAVGLTPYWSDDDYTRIETGHANSAKRAERRRVKRAERTLWKRTVEKGI